MRDTVSSAYAKLQAERAQAAAEGRLAEFDGHLVGRIVPELIPISKITKLGEVSKLSKLEKATDTLADIKKLEKTTDAVADASKLKKTTGKAQEAKKALAKGKAKPKQAPCATQSCPLADASKKPSSPKKSQKPGKNKSKKSTQKNAKTAKGGEPVSMASGEELLELQDFAWDGPLALDWSRLYRSGQSGEDLQLGHGWLTPLDEWLDVDDEGVSYHDAEGRTVELPLPDPGGHSLNLPEQLRLYREDGHYRLAGEDGPDRIFVAGQGRCRLLRWQNETGQSVELVYDETGQAKALAGSWGKALLIQREGRRIAAISPARLGKQGYEPVAAPLVHYQYDADGDLVAALDRVGEGERYAYQNHVIVRRTLASGFNFHFEWDRHAPEGRCVRSHGDHGIYDTHFEWTDGGISRAIDSRGGVSEYMHDAHALLLWETTPEGRTTHYAYDENRLLRSVTDPAGQTSRYEYDDEGRMTAAIDPLGQVWRLEYGADGKPTALADPLGQTWRRAYNGQGQLVQIQDPQGGTTRITYNGMGLPAQIFNALGQSRTLLWDGQARLVGDTGFDGIRRTYQYDSEDRITAAAQDQRLTQYQYDAAGRLAAVKGPDGAVVRLQYNAAGRLTHHIDPAGRTTEYRYADGLSQPSERIDPAGHVLGYRYDSERNLIGLVNAKGEEYRLDYDKDENLVAETGFDGREQRYQYGPGGSLQAYAQRQGGGWLVSHFERDPLGRLLKKTGPDGETAEYGYDPLGRLHHAHNADGQLHFHYNALGQVVEETQNGEAVRHEYDALGQRTATITPDGWRIDYARDAQGRVQSVELDGQTLTRHRYDEFGQESARQQGAVTSRYDYDPAGRLLRQQAGFAGDRQPVLSRRYSYDPTGKLAAVEDLRHGMAYYRYDPADRLVQVEAAIPEHFVHDQAGNIVAAQEGSGLVKGDRLLLLGDRHFDYDDAGNLIEERRGTGGRLVTRYRYDSDNRLVRAETPQGVSTYRYDPLGRRIAKTTPQGETRFVYDGANLLAEIQDGRQSLHLFEPGSFRPLMRIDLTASGNVVYYYHLDHLGTPREMTDAQGQTVWSGQYRAYGSLALADVALIDNPLWFQGQYFDAETGLHYNLNRYYDPRTGRFIHQDPIGLEGGDNLYQYAPNPVNWIDPWGLSHLNTNSAKGNFGVYKIEIDGQLYKYGKADMNRVTQSSGLPTRLHQQLVKLRKLNPDSDVRGEVLKDGFKTTTEAKAEETARLQKHFESTGEVPKGNQKSFKPKPGSKSTNAKCG